MNTKGKLKKKRTKNINLYKHYCAKHLMIVDAEWDSDGTCTKWICKKCEKAETRGSRGKNEQGGE